ncbi:hypothetical protein TBR22_A04610 [Luteitalea sp. TBR-22]|uniref:DNA/RNA helicase domain-containing protein n=1 Tax=Luteitalea sp. TBR-22 TaxID=2802971 RepID=UPI001AF7035B|nr:DNA/RNA helicase domain-containing protein [Luteitalea sp. TBR-22]BCS31261.1 hypothetical protein TBR22_A04610 [Luteitalea sp. TBR-22]
MTEQRARYGWESDFPGFSASDPKAIRDRLQSFVRDASPEQLRAWTDSIPPLQREVGEVLLRDQLAGKYSAILEYELPLESRRPDVVLLVGDGVLVIELKGKEQPSQADIDQAAAYARDLKCYHRECWEREVVPVLVPTRARGYVGQEGHVHVAGPDAVDWLVEQLSARAVRGDVLSRERFLDEDAYCPLPTLIEAARELFESRTLRRIHRAHADTAPALDAISEIIHHAAATGTRHLVLLTGVPGAGKTLVGLQTAHARFLDDLAVSRGGGRPASPAVFLSGNGPLVEVLQYEFRSSGGGGKTFVRGVKDYVKTYSRRPDLVPPEHILIFDEAQRAFDAEMVAAKHPDQHGPARSEPEHFIDFADRVKGWCVVLGLIGTGQEIHVGEEGGLGQWRIAVEGSRLANQWTVHAPLAVAEVFEGAFVPLRVHPALNLDTSLRQHQASELHAFVRRLLEAAAAEELRPEAAALEHVGFNFRITRSLEVAKAYMRERYGDDRDARFGVLASSRDRDLVKFGVMNDFQSTKRVRVGPWYGDAEDAYASRSCRLMEECVTEFAAQGLELDATLLAWGSDLRLVDGAWSNSLASKYQRRGMVKDAMQLRLNSYRVLLTRGRDACAIFVPPLECLDETWQYFVDIGFTVL